MKIIKSISAMKKASAFWKSRNKKIGFVPTMGALHEGHLALVSKAKKENDIVVVSIFVNPTQFGPKEDLSKYPRPFKNDVALLKKLKVDFLFFPDAVQMYPQGYKTTVDVKDLGKYLCGASRPSHFSGVATVVCKFFNIVSPTIAYFGEKDFQQQVIIKRIVQDLNMDVLIKTIATIRESDGLAKSSRNTYLSKNERLEAVVLRHSLLYAKNLIMSGQRKSSVIINEMKKIILKDTKFVVDYISINDPFSLEPVNMIHSKKVLIAVAAKIGTTRLIDNIVVNL